MIQRMQSAWLKFNPEKCKLFQRRVDFLGAVVGADGVQPNPDKVAVIKSWPEPRDLTQLRTWLGLIGYYRRWIDGFAKRARPLFDLMRKNMVFIWADAQQKAF